MGCPWALEVDVMKLQIRTVSVGFASLIVMMAAVLVPIAMTPAEAVAPLVRLPNSTLPSLSSTNVTPLGAQQSDAPMTVTVTLRRSHQSDFDQYLSSVQTPS